MSKLFKLKEWLTLDEAVLHLSNVIGDPVTIADLYRFALDGHIKLSVRFVNGAYGVKGKWLKADDIANDLSYNDVTKQSPSNPAKSPEHNEMFVSGDDWISWGEYVEPIRGVWDLTMKGGESFDIADYYQESTSSLRVTTRDIKGILLQQKDVVCQLYRFRLNEQNSLREGYSSPKERLKEGNGYYSEQNCFIYPLTPDSESIHYMFFNYTRKNYLGMYFESCTHLAQQDSVLVIKTSEITRFIQSLEDTPQEAKPLTSNERNSLLVLIAALCKEANIDPSKRGASVPLVAMTGLIGAPLSDETIRNILKQIEAAVCSRSK